MRKLFYTCAVVLLAALLLLSFAGCETTPIKGDTGEKGDTGATGPKGEQGEKGDTGPKGDAGRGILKVEVIDGALWVTYTDDPDHPVKIGELDEAEEGTDGLDFYPLPDGTYGVKGGKAIYLTDIVIPATHKGKAVTRILPQAFRDCQHPKHITIPSSVTGIGDSAFYGCTGLTSITIGEGVTSISNDAFYGCTGLTGVYIKDIAAWCTIAFESFSANPLAYARRLYLNGSPVYNLKIPDGVTCISDSAFIVCCNLTSVTLPNSLTRIGKNAFNSCIKLTSVELSGGILSIGDDAFSTCPNLLEVVNHSTLNIVAGSQDNGSIASSAKHIISNKQESYLTTNENGYIFYDDGSNTYLMGYVGTDTELILPKASPKGKMYEIHPDVFFECIEFTSITIPDSMTNIGDSAFEGCTGLTSITIPSSVTSISSSAFWGCTGLTNITIPNSVTSIGNSAFGGCTGLTSITIPSSVTNIGSSAFSDCTGLTSITIPSSVTSIGSHAFSDCTGLTSITIPDSVTNIGYNAFEGCTGLTSITIPNSVTSIDSFAFGGCERLKNIYFSGSKEEWDAIQKANARIPNDCTIHYNYTPSDE